MDIRTGRTYETIEAARADGVPEAAIPPAPPCYDAARWMRSARLA